MTSEEFIFGSFIFVMLELAVLSLSSLVSTIVGSIFILLFYIIFASVCVISKSDNLLPWIEKRLKVKKDPIEELKKQYVKGEISDQEFENKMNKITEGESDRELEFN